MYVSICLSVYLSVCLSVYFSSYLASYDGPTQQQHGCPVTNSESLVEQTKQVPVGTKSRPWCICILNVLLLRRFCLVHWDHGSNLLVTQRLSAICLPLATRKETFLRPLHRDFQCLILSFLTLFNISLNATSYASVPASTVGFHEREWK